LSLQDQLRALSELDARVRGLSRRLNAGNTRLKALQTKHDQSAQQADELDGQLKIAQAKASDFENEAGDVDQRIEKLRAQMNSVTSNKEYSSLLLEVNTIKANKSKLEDEALAQMNVVEELQQRLADVQSKMEDQAKLVAAAQKEVDEAKTEVGEKLDEATHERKAKADELPPELITQLDRLAEDYDGEAVCGIEEQNRRRMEYTCAGCYMSLPVELVNALMTRPDELITCTNCQRMLVISEDLKTAIGSK